jgi:anti-anti-sigma factor
MLLTSLTDWPQPPVYATNVHHSNIAGLGLRVCVPARVVGFAVKESDMEMEVEEADGGVALVILRGRLDTVGANAIDLKFNAVAGARRAIVVDLSAVDFLASLGIRVLVLGARAVKNKGGKLVILSPNDGVRGVLSAAHTDTLIPIFPDRAAAVAAVTQ